VANWLHHEQLYRGANLAQLADVHVTICGAGALGSHLADNLVRLGFQQLRVIDNDRVEEHNVGTQLYGLDDVGAWKVEALRQRLFRAANVEIEAVRKELTDGNTRKLLANTQLIVDAFDNSRSRQLVQQQSRQAQVACLHAGLHEDYGEVIWDEQYRVPGDTAGDVCDYPLARNLVLLVAAVASEEIVRHVLEGVRGNWSVTLRDFSVRPLE
jgi:molybdopterin/thiamine biosynthesis adenylyltransferase